MIESNKIIGEFKHSSILYELSSIERLQLKECLLSMLSDIILVCKKYNLEIMLGGGSALGAIRHNGFIPWDDDLDLMMPRNDYEKFIEIFPLELSNNYSLRVPNSQYEISNNYMKIIRKNTLIEEIFTVNTPFENGIFIDVFPIEYAPNSKILRRVKGFISDLLAYIGVSRYMYQFRNDIVEQYFSQNWKGKFNYKLRIALGFISGFWDYRKWYNFFDIFVQAKKETNYCTIPTGRNHYYNECLERDVFFPTRKGTFENIEVNLPGKIDTYLSNLYGAYMQIPPESKRERHYYIGFKCK